MNEAAFSTDGKRLAITTHLPGTRPPISDESYLINFDSDKEVLQRTLSKAAFRFAFSQDGKQLAIQEEQDGATIVLIDSTSGKEIGIYP